MTTSEQQLFSIFINGLTDGEIEYLLDATESLDHLENFQRDPVMESIINMVADIVGIRSIFHMPQFTPAPRLVGVEPNPGPDHKNKNKKKQVTTTTTKTVQKSKKRAKQPKILDISTRGSRFSDVGIKRFRTPPSAADYLKALTHPFTAPAPKLGYGTFVPTSKHTVWFEKPSAILNVLTSHFAVVTVADIGQGAMVYEQVAANLNTALSSASTETTYSCTNATTIASLAQTGRPINWGMRVKVRTSANSLPGTLGCIVIPEETRSAIEASSCASLTALAGYRPCVATASGTVGGEVQYRPSDNFDFDFLPSVATNALANIAATNLQMIIVGTGWPPGAFQVEITTIGHIETLGGTDASGEADGEPDMVDGQVAIDSLAAIIASAGEPVITSLEALEVLDETNSNIRRAQRMRSIAGLTSSISSAIAGNSVMPTPSNGSHYVLVR